MSTGMDRMTRKIHESELMNIDFVPMTLITNDCSWTLRRKWGITLIVSSYTFISPVSSAMIAPATDQLAEQFGITSDVVMAMTTSIFVLGYGTISLGCQTFPTCGSFCLSDLGLPFSFIYVWIHTSVLSVFVDTWTDMMHTLQPLAPSSLARCLKCMVARVYCR